MSQVLWKNTELSVQVHDEDPTLVVFDVSSSTSNTSLQRDEVHALLRALREWLRTGVTAEPAAP